MIFSLFLQRFLIDLVNSHHVFFDVEMLFDDNNNNDDIPDEDFGRGAAVASFNLYPNLSNFLDNNFNNNGEIDDHDMYLDIGVESVRSILINNGNEERLFL